MKKNLVNSTKLWNIKTDGKSHTVSYGKVNGKLTKKVKKFETIEACEKDAEKLIKSKINGGYIELSISIKDVDLDFLYRIEQVQRGNATEIEPNNRKIWESSDELLTEIWKCTALEHLHIAGINDGIGNLVNLKSLEFSLREDQHVPSSIKHLNKLEELKIHFAYQGECIIPDEIAALSSLKKLIIFVNEDSVIPNAICQLTALEYLEIHGSIAYELPQTLGNLSHLKTLKIERANDLQALPSSIGELKNLETLIVRECRSAYGKTEDSGLIIPKEIGQLSNLIELNLEENGLTTLPEEIGQLSKLTKLHIESNLFEHFPVILCQLTSLDTLEMRCRRTEIKEIPEALTNLKNLEEFSINLAEKSNIPEQFIVSEGFGSINVESIFDYFSSLKNKKSDVDVIVSEAPANKKELVEQRAPLFDNTFTKINNRSLGESPLRIKALKDFVSGESNELPVALRDDVHDYKYIVDLLVPFNEWNFIDQRILQFITQDAFYFPKKNILDEISFRGYHNEFFDKWLLPQLETEEQGGNLLQDVFNCVINAGIEETLCFEAFLSAIPAKTRFFNTNNTPNSIGNYIIEKAKADITNFADVIIKHNLRSPFIKLMLLEHRALLDECLPQLLTISEYLGTGGSNKHIPFSLLELLLAHDFNAYEHYVHQLVAQTDCHECIMECYRVLAETNEQEYKQVTLEKIKETLVIISDKKNDTGEDFSWSVNSCYGDNTKGFIDWALSMYGEALQQAVHQYLENTRRHNLEITATILNHFGEDALQAVKHDFKVTTTSEGSVEYYRSLLHILSQVEISNPVNFSAVYDEVWKLAGNKKLELSQMAAFQLSRTGNETVISKAVKYINSKKDSERLAALRVLYYLNDPQYFPLIESMLNTEQKPSIREVAVMIVYGNEDFSAVTIDEMKQRVQVVADLGLLKTQLLKSQSKLPPLLWADGNALTKQEVNYLLYRQSLNKTISADVELRPLFNLLEPESAQTFASELWNLILKTEGINIKPKGLLAPVGILGSDDLIDSLLHEALKNKKLQACQLLGLMNTEAAAWALDRIIKANAESYNTMLREAEAAFAAIADHLNLTSLELQERMLPDFGFTELEQEFIENDIHYTRFIDRSLLFAYKDQQGKIIKNIPKASAEFKKAQKESNALLRTVVKQFSQSLNSHLITQKFWMADDWQAFFLTHPVAFAFAQNSVWQNAHTYFIVDANGHLVNAQGDAVELTAKDKISLAHPIQMGLENIQIWDHYLRENDLSSPFNQLERNLHGPAEEDYHSTIGSSFEDQAKLVGKFKYRARKSGWRTGAVVSGEVTSYQKTFAADNIDVFIETRGLPIREGYEDTMNLGRFYFVPMGSVNTQSFMYNAPYDEQDKRLIPFSEVPPIVFSETIADLVKITDDEMW
ncbi:leucine-rich repeat domain-containing protein [Psychromonas algicola]|uniref:leucine-rich repeat domain-containing protein n=1 Tax=Psychromonas algicola TaxID=2555642 RepID=UPI0010675AFB|nr:DUF4132 domain-containing protein [Psychromonas sp. RZ5]TEW51683.1 DUF4132 domain-containing protein [Psychromonas sp. RZ5]